MMNRNSTWTQRNFKENSSFDSTGKYCLETDDISDNFENDNNNFEDDNNFEDNDAYNFKSRNEELKTITKQDIRLDQKINIISTASLHPNWSIEKIRKHTQCEFVQDRHQILEWTRQIKDGPSWDDQLKAVNRWVFAKCLDYQKKHRHLKPSLSNEMITRWGLEAKDKLIINNRYYFCASKHWVMKFRKIYHLSGKSPHLYIERNYKSKSKSL